MKTLQLSKPHIQLLADQTDVNEIIAVSLIFETPEYFYDEKLIGNYSKN